MQGGCDRHAAAAGPARRDDAYGRSLTTTWPWRQRLPQPPVERQPTAPEAWGTDAVRRQLARGARRP
eukprot:2804242-Lingulodinium_polyedra.AAC.1